MIISDICKECGGACCKGELLGNVKCRWMTDTGCNLCEKHRSHSCLTYPFVIVRDTRFTNPQRIYIDTSCHYWKEFVDYKDNLDKEDLEYFVMQVIDMGYAIPTEIIGNDNIRVGRMPNITRNRAEPYVRDEPI